MYAEEAGARPVLTTETTSVDLDRPSRSATRLDISSGVDFSRGVTLDDAAAADQVFAILMGEDVESRRTFIQKNARDVRFLDI